MPNYDFRCAAGHVSEAYVSRDTHETACPCGLVARRELSVPGITGRPTPTRYAPIPQSRFLEAQHELVDTARRTNTEPPDALAEARRRIARGDVQAID